MGTFVSTFIPYDATGRAVNLDTEYMYRDDGLKLKVIRFEYYKCDDADYNWFILAQIECSNAIKEVRYKVCELYLDCPSNANVQCAIQDLNKLKLEVVKLGLNIYYGRGKSNVLFEMAKQIETDLLAIIQKLENPNVE
jgi:hypothetical protein